MLTGEPAPTGPARRGAKPPPFPVAAIDDPALPELLSEPAAARAEEMEDAEGGTSAPMLPARSRHASVRSLERYARPGVDSVARHVAERDPAARRHR